MGAVDPVAAVGAITDEIRSACGDIDTTRQLPTSVVDALRDVGVFRLLAPRDLGGAEADPLTFLRVVEAAAHADGSVGWCVMIGGCYAVFAGMLPADAAKEIYGDPATISAGAFRPMGVADETDDGYVVSGRWTLGSGSTHANWFVAGCAVRRDGAPVIGPTGAPLFREVFLPSDAVEIIETWDSTGLRGTASHDYAVHEAFVPRVRSCWFQEPPVAAGPLYRMPPVAMFATFIGAVPLGVARHAIEEFQTVALGKGPGIGPALADKGTTHDAVGRAQALVGSGRAYVTGALEDLWERVQAGYPPTLADRGALWLSATHAAHTALEAIELLYTASGSTAVYATSPLDRCLRDARTAVQHVTTQVGNYELAGAMTLDRFPTPSPWGLDYRGEDR